MKYFTLWLCLISVLLSTVLWGCKENNDSPEETEKVAPVFEMADVGPETVALINKEVERLVLEMDTYEVKGPITVNHLDGLAEMTLFNFQGLPTVIKTQRGQREQWFFLYNRRVIFLREVNYFQDHLTENKFYYSNTGMIKALEKEAKDQAGLATAESNRYRRKSQNDYRLDVREVNFLIIKFLYGEI